MKLQKTLLLFATLTLILNLSYSCRDDDDLPIIENPEIEEPEFPAGTKPLEASPQRTGDAETGYDYLLNGDFVDSGIPYDLYIGVFGRHNDNELNREGDSADLPPNFTAITASNGVKIAVANCFTCHAQKLNGEYIVGLGNSFSDYTEDRSASFGLVDNAIIAFYGQDSPEWEAYEPFRTSAVAIGPHLITEAIGVNAADKLTAVLAAHRDPNDLTWLENPNLPIPDATVPSDVPAWWLMKKKNTMFYNGSGRGDLARIMMASSLLTLKDVSKAEEVDAKFGDVYAFIANMDAPIYPDVIEPNQLAEGKKVFETHCAKCHGTYSEDENYPNLLVDIDVIGTDPMLMNYENDYAAFVDWFNNGWFGQGENGARFEFGNGYVAPPLDGVWATAPYLHNGSVPNLETLLNSSLRPKYWKRTFEDTDYDFEKVGWNYTEESEASSKDIYDTTLPGYGNQGHNFGDVLTDTERKNLIEYLKSL